MIRIASSRLCARWIRSRSSALITPSATIVSRPKLRKVRPEVAAHADEREVAQLARLHQGLLGTLDLAEQGERPAGRGLRRIRHVRIPPAGSERRLLLRYGSSDLRRAMSSYKIGSCQGDGR